MHEVDGKLAKWKKLYEQHRDAQERLNKALRGAPSDANITTLKAEVAMLGKASNAALEEVQAALAVHKSGLASGLAPLK